MALSFPPLDARGGAMQAPGPLAWIARLGLAALALWQVLALYVAILRGRDRLDLPAFAVALHQCGLSILPAVTLVALALGMLLGDQAQVLLNRLNLPGLVLPLLIHAVVVEFMPLLIALLVAGRAGVALAVRQATLTATGEIDGLLTQGIDPIRFTLGPVLLAMLLMSFAIAVWGSLLTIAAAALWMWLGAGQPLGLFVEALAQALGPAEWRDALIKPVLFALLVALVASVNGLTAGRDPQGIASAATGTMIGTVTTLLVADLVYLWVMRG